MFKVKVIWIDMAVFLILFHFRQCSILQWSSFMKQAQDRGLVKHVFHSVLKIKFYIFSNCALKRFFFWRRWLDDMNCRRRFTAQKSSFHITLMGPLKTHKGRQSTHACFSIIFSLFFSVMKAAWKQKEISSNVLSLEKSKNDKAVI